MVFKKIETLSNKQIEALGATFPEHNEYICETAGFVPLDVKLKRFQEAGQILQFSQSEFTSSDLRQMYLNPDFEINPEDDLEDINEKLVAREKYKQDLIMKKKKQIQALEAKASEAAAAGSHKKPIQTSEPEEDVN